MKNENKILLFVVLWVLFLIGVQIGIHHGKELGYAQGWSDAHCGPNNSCEAGDE